MQAWAPTSWLHYPYDQCTPYPDEAQLNLVVKQLSQLPPLIKPQDIDRLKTLIAKAGHGEAFILQGGDCAELFQDCRPEIIHNKLKLLFQMSLVLRLGLQVPVICVGRMAGQYAKPRSNDFETINDLTLPSYRGDLINASEFNPFARQPDPTRMLRGYHCAHMTLTYIHAFLNAHLTDLHHPKHWNLDFLKHTHKDYRSMLHTITDSTTPLNTLDFYTSHEALNLHYEQALTHHLKDRGWYNLSTHLPWIGRRTAQINSAHLEFLRGIENPVGIKIGPEITGDTLKQLLHMLNPAKEVGRILLITRLGAKQVTGLLPLLIQAVQSTRIPVTWSCDPMHGNTILTSEGKKTRNFDTILEELRQTSKIHQEHYSNLGGIHFELTGDHVTECIGGAQGLTMTDLHHDYRTPVDPRLNYEQSLELAFQLSNQWFKTGMSLNKRGSAHPANTLVCPANAL